MIGLHVFVVFVATVVEGISVFSSLNFNSKNSRMNEKFEKKTKKKLYIDNLGIFTITFSWIWFSKRVLESKLKMKLLQLFSLQTKMAAATASKTISGKSG